MSARTWSRLLLAIVAAHVLFAAARMPHAAMHKRWQEIERWRADGPVPWFFEGGDRDVVAWLLRHTPPDGAILWRGGSEGAIELVPGVLFPRLLVHEAHVPLGAGEAFGRPLARGTPPGSSRDGFVVLVATGERLELALR